MKNTKRILGLLLAMVLLISSIPTMVFAETTPVLPSATVTSIKSDNLTFAMNFLLDNPTAEQLAYFGDWYADFEITFNKDVTFDANGTGDGWLSGQYDSWSLDWVNAPIKPVTIKAGETVKIMEFAADLLGKSGLKLTYQEVCASVKDFDCGVYFDEEFLLANPDIQVDLALKMYSPDGTTSATIGDALKFTNAPDLPTAKISQIKNDDLTFAMNFRVNSVTEEQLAYYGNWYADFELTINKEVTFNNDGSADGWLAGQYDEWSYDWVTVPFGKKAPVTVKANETVKIMAFAAEFLDEPGLKYTFKEVYETVKDFNCGVYFDDEFLANNPDLKVTLELKMYNPANEAESYIVGETYTYTNPIVAKNINTGKVYTSVNDAMMAAQVGETVVLLKDVSETIVSVFEDATLDLNGYTLAAQYVSCFGDIIDSSAANAGLLSVSANRFMIREDNAQLPIRNGNGYRFVEVLKFNAKYDAASSIFGFQPFVEAGALEWLKEGSAATGVTIQVQITWKQSTGYRSQNFVYNDTTVNDFLGSYISSTGKYGRMLFLTLKGAENYDELTFTVMVVSETNVAFTSNN